MQPLVVHESSAMPLRRTNVDTDQIIPAEYLKRISRHGFEDALFAGWRQDPDFVLNDPAYRGATILVAGADFGTGSSREHAVWALHDYGFRVVFSSRFADIFRGNAGKGGLLAAQVPQDVIERMWLLVERDPGCQFAVDLAARRVVVQSAGSLMMDEEFDVDDYVRYRLLNGLDDIGLTLQNEDAIAAFEAVRSPLLPSI